MTSDQTNQGPSNPGQDHERSADAESKAAATQDREAHPEQTAAEDHAPPPIPFYKRPILMTVLIAAAVIIIVGGVAWWLYSRQFETTDDAFIDGNIVDIAPKVSGYVDKLLVNDNQLVQQGDLLLRIDPRDYEAALADAQAALASAVGAHAQAKARVDAAIAEAAADEAQVAAAHATTENAQQDYDRNSRLAPRSVSQQTLDSSAATAASTHAEEIAARARADSAAQQVKLAESQLVSAQADVGQAQAKVEEANLKLSYTKIIAPVQGRVTHRTVELGDYLQPGQPLFALVEPNLWVIANFKETQLNEMRPGQPVKISIDAYPDRPLHAHVDSFQRGTGARFSALPPENATGNYVKVVQRVPVKIVFDQPIPDSMVLGPGMSVEPKVSVRGEPPNGANPSTEADAMTESSRRSNRSGQL